MSSEKEISDAVQEMRQHNLTVYKDLGFFALKSLLTLNGGAIIVLLTFVSGIMGNSANVSQISVPVIESAIIAFLLGLFFCFLTVLANIGVTLRFLAKPLETTGAAGFLFWLFVTPLVSFGFFVVGVLVALEAFQ